MTHYEYSSDDSGANSESSDEWYQVPPDATGESPTSATVTEAVSAVTGTDQNSLRPLYEVIDPEALDRLFSSTDEAPEREDSGGQVIFRYEGKMIYVFGSGRVVVAPTDEE